MSKEITEKKVYPSQLNTKTISARIPINDYVEFLKDSLSKGISLNDWLLLKIYNIESSNKESIISDNSINENNIRINIMDLNPHQYDYWKEDFEANDYWDIDKESIIELMEMVRVKQYYLDQFNRRQASVQDIKTQLTVLIKNKFIDTEDQKEYRKEIFRLLKELE